MADETTSVGLDTSEYEAAIERATRVGTEFFEKGIAGNKALEKAYRATLTPAEKTALKMSELALSVDEAARKSEGFVTVMTAMAKQSNRQAEASGTFAKAMKAVATESDSAKKALEEQTKANKALADAFGLTKKKADAVETAFGALNLPGADLVNRYKQMQDAFQNAAEAGGKQEVSLLKQRVAMFGVAGAIAAVTAGFVSVVAKGAEWNKELEKSGQALQTLEHQGLRQNAAALEALTTRAKLMAVEFSATVGPAVAYMADGMTIINMVLRDGWSKDLPSYGRELDVVKRRLLDTGQAAKESAANIGMFTTLLGKQKDDYKTWSEERQRSLSAETKASIDAAVAADEAEQRKREAWRQSVIAHKSTTQEIIGEWARGTAVLKERIDEVANATGAQFRNPSLMQEPVKGQVDASISEFGRLAAASEATAEKVKSAYFSAATSLASSAGQAFQMWQDGATKAAESASAKIDSLQAKFDAATTKGEKARLKARIDSLKKQESANEAAALKAFRLQQATGAVSVGISTAQAVMQALGSLPPPASYIAAGAAVAAGAVQLAAIFSQSPPTSGASSSLAAAPSAPQTQAGVSIAQRGRGSSAADIADAPNASVSRSQGMGDTVSVTDAYYPAVAGRRTLRLAAGDEAEVTRSGRLGSSKKGDPALLAATREQTAEVRGLRASIDMLTQRLLMRDHFAAAAGPAGRY